MLINELKDLNVEEVSLVGKPANQREFLLLKNQEGGCNVDVLDSVLKSLGELDIDLENEELVDKAMKAMKLDPNAVKAVKGALKLMEAYKEQIPKGILDKLMSMMMEYEEGMDYMEHSQKEKMGAGKEKEKGMGMNPEKKIKKEDGSLDLSAIPEESRELVQMLWKEQETAVKKAQELETILKAEREIRIAKEFLDRGIAFPNIGTAEAVGSVLRKAYDVSEDYGKQLEGILKDANTKIEKSELFVEKGSNARSSADTTWAKIEELAKGIVIKGEGQTMAQAIDRVLAENPKLYDEYTKERSGK